MENISYLRETQAVPHLHETQAILGLSQQELAELFGVREPSLAEWMTRGVPETCYASVEDLHDLALLLNREVLGSHIPKLVRSPDPWLGNRTILEIIARDGVGPIHRYLARLFAYRE